MKKKSILSSVIAALLVACLFTSTASASTAAKVDIATFSDIVATDGTEVQFFPAALAAAAVAVGYVADRVTTAPKYKVVGTVAADGTNKVDYEDIKVIFDN